MPTGDPDQLALIGPRGGLLPRAPTRTSALRAAASDPVALVQLDSPLPRLDRPFDYLVPAALHEQARFGVKVRVPFGRQRLEGWVVGRCEAAGHGGELQFVDAVVGPEPVLTVESLALCRRVADHYLGTLSDVLRLAVPPRHAAAAAAQAEPVALPLPGAAISGALRPGPGAWVWTCPPGRDWARPFAASLAAVAAAGGRGLAVVPDGRDLRRLADAVAALLPTGAFAVIAAQDGPATRYRAFRAALEGIVPIIIGTRSASFAPLPAPDLLLLWDDGDDSHAERRAPYPHAREVLAMRATPATTFIAGAYGRSCQAQRWLDIGWARSLAAPRAQVRAMAPRVRATGDDTGPSAPGQRAGRLPADAGAAIRAGLRDGPVLVSVARTGYLPRLRCRDCGSPADCPSCGGALAIGADGALAACTRCARPAAAWRCPVCGGGLLRSSAVGSARTAEELGRAFANVPVVLSSGKRIVQHVPARPALVVATPGAEPFAERGYTAVALLDIDAALALPDLRAAEQAARRWFNAGALARPGAPLVVVAEPGLPVVQALIRWDPGWFAARELAQREETGMPPARKSVLVAGPHADLADLVAGLPPSVTVLGPVPDGQRYRVLLTVPHREARDLLVPLRAILVRRSAEGAAMLAVRVDPPDAA